MKTFDSEKIILSRCVHPCNPSTQEVEAGGLGVQGQPMVAYIIYMQHCLKKIKAERRVERAKGRRREGRGEKWKRKMGREGREGLQSRLIFNKILLCPSV